ncbi:methionyl-tRNA formyltransferase [Phycicoccus jejuensis]|uniref:methionyl-tRNA formyltransferase n=1 Tax=Phycicoccus jejuensis TaxID=367299 RepID=UPI0004C32D03|nr:methionyl-tRNA formyltransferase [Phycicoccus jejuensis]
MRLVLAGTPDTAVPSLRALLASRHEVAAVVTRPDARAGRGRTLHPSPVKEVALEHGLEVLTPARPGDPDFLDRLREIAPDCCPVVAYGALLPRPALDVPRHGWVNLHFSLLPAWRGAAPVQRAVMAGDEVTGASTFVIEEGLDTGPVLGTVTEPVRPTDTAGTLLERLAGIGAGLLVATMDGLEDGSLRGVPQPDDGVSHAPKLTVAECEVRWSLPAHLVDRQVRGATPNPGAWSTFRDERLGIGPFATADLPPDLPALAAGELHATKRALLVGTASGPVVLGEVRPQGKRAMAAADWARGVRIAPGERLG